MAAFPAVAQINGINEAINKAGRQRMLSQRMAKAWLAVGQDVESSKAEKILFDSMALFDRQFVELKAFAPNAEIKSTYSALESIWSEYKGVLVGASPAVNTTPSLIKLDNMVLALANQGTVQLEKFSGHSVGKLVNLAGRQRMLSQRMAKYYLSNRWGALVPDQVNELNKARDEFQRALTVLADAPEATNQIRQEIEIASQQWVFFDNALQRLTEATNTKKHAVEVFASSERLLTLMDHVTSLYSQLT
ncbi:MAG: type IV pili methyl-accepting chemotaxis transducer N-terminal domain-containing protein [Burkholderiales bacterium]|nr:type IV pili methyl-accepting chemotaxis transducer N-terminal domain-containing protein [Burkholderiales bacterium]